METFYNWHLMRGLAFLLAIGVFVLYAWLLGTWQEGAKRRARPTTEQDDVDTVAPKMARDIEHRATGAQRISSDDVQRPVPERRAA